MPKPRNREGVLAALSAAILFGASIPISKLLLAELQPRVLATLLYLGSGMGLILWVGLSREGKSSEASLQRSDLPFLAGSILFGGVLVPVALLMGLQKTPSSMASLLMNLEGAMTIALAWLIFRENLGGRVIIGVLTVIAGGLLLTWIGVPEMPSIRGPIMIAVACLGWGLDNNLSQGVSTRDPRRIAIIKGLMAGAINFTIAIVLAESFKNWTAMLVALIMGFFSYGLSLVLFIRALRDLGTDSGLNSKFVAQ